MADTAFLSKDRMESWLRSKMIGSTPYQEIACYSVALNLLGIQWYWSDYPHLVNREKYLEWLNRTMDTWENLNHPIQGFAELMDVIARGEFDVHVF
jgi:hypothetical protein